MSQSGPKELVIATTNLGKLREIGLLLQGAPLVLLRPSDKLGYAPEVVEDGERFEDNAVIKAKAVAELTRCVTLADDSGLEVDALNGMPGVRSARYAGQDASDADNNRALLAALSARGLATAPARFRCAMALAAPDGAVLAVTSGVCAGYVRTELRGHGGFGYDPLFVVDELGERTLAELSDSEKNAVSHRGRALRAMLPELLRLAQA
jgi:XTP/dITP diphosphohydrolase